MHIKTCLLGLVALFAASLIIGPATPEAAALPAAQTEERVTSLDLLLQPGSYAGRRIQAVMDVQCEDEDICWIGFSFVPRRPISLDITSTESASRKALLQNCMLQRCQIVAFGTLDPETFVATKIEFLDEEDSDDFEDFDHIEPLRYKKAQCSNCVPTKFATLVPPSRYKPGGYATT